MKLLRVGSPVLAFVGLLAFGLIGWQLLQGALPVGTAGLRGLVVIVVLVVADRLVLPLCRTLVGSAARDRA